MSPTDCLNCGESIPDGTSRCPECGTTSRRQRMASFRFTTGEIIDNRYEVLSRIPGGGMGELYKVRHLHLHDVRAIKILRGDQLSDDNYRQRFLREARIAASIKHPNLALLHDFATLPDRSFYMVEEFIEGKTLAKCLREGQRFSLNEIVEIAKQVLLGLGAIHDTGIIHRDISPDNIMLASSKTGGIRVKIIDLGIARSIDPSEAHSLTSAGLFIGKPHYASPEQMRLIEDDTPIDHRTDLYSLGVVLYEVVSGRVPFEASTPFEYLMKQLAGDELAIDRSVADLVPPDLERFIVTLLRAKREDRFESTLDALRALSKIRLGAATIQDVPVGEGDAAYPVSAPSKKRRQTAEVPIEQLRKLIEQDRTAHGHQRIVTPHLDEPAQEPTEIEDLDDSRKVTLMQLDAVRPTQDIPRPRAAAEETERAPLPAQEEPEPIAFVPQPTQEPDRPETPPERSAVVQFPPPPDAAVPLARRGPNPLTWFVAGIAFVAVVSVGGYLVYKWLDTRFGKPVAEVAASTTTSPTTAAVIPTATDSEATDNGNSAPIEPADEIPSTPGNASPPSPAASRPVIETSPADPVRATPPPPPAKKPAPPELAATPRTATSTEQALVDPATDPNPDPATPSGETTAQEAITSSAPVVLPGSTDDVREGDLVAPGPGVVAPVVTRTVEPIYPPLSSNMGYEGIAMFSVLVGPDGKPEIVKLIVSSGSEPLDKSAEDAARQTVFTPATKNGIKVRMWKTLRFQFKKTKGY